MAVPYLACMMAVAHFYHLPPRVLPSIQAVEGGFRGAINRNADGSEDLGVMQINTIWVGPMARAAGLPEAEVRRRLADDACFNIAAAGLVMRTYLLETHGNLMAAVGDYHSHTPVLNAEYQARVTAAARALFARQKG
jgi:hypothetical protein